MTRRFEHSGWLSPAEAASVLPGASAMSVRKWCAAAKVPGAIRLPSGRWQIPWSAVVQIMGFDPRESNPPPEVTSSLGRAPAFPSPGPKV